MATRKSNRTPAKAAAPATSATAVVEPTIAYTFARLEDRIRMLEKRAKRNDITLAWEHSLTYRLGISLAIYLTTSMVLATMLVPAWIFSALIPVCCYWMSLLLMRLMRDMWNAPKPDNRKGLTNMAITEEFSLPQGIGPHEDRELELLLAGTKPLARIRYESAGWFAEQEPVYKPHVDAGTIKRFTSTHDHPPVQTVYYCLPTEEWRVKLMESMQSIWAQPEHGGYSMDDHSRIEGHLLGYTKQDIETFITHWNRKR